MKKIPSRLLISSLLLAVIVIAPALSARAVEFTRDLAVGSTGTDVSNLQIFLRADGTVYPEKLVTGYFGPLTRQAVMRFQAKNGIASVGRVGPITRAAINAQQLGGTGGADDISAPIISLTSGTSTQNTLRVTWVTNEETFGRVMYGTSWPFLYATAPSIGSANGFSTAHTVTVPNLSGNAQYYYVIESKDAAGNTSYTLSTSIRTQQ